MRWLLWKDYRHNRLIVFTALFLLLLPHLAVLGAICWGNTYAASRWRENIAIACLYSIGFSVIGFAVMGGNAIAGERVDRSAEFLFILPVQRRKLLASKLLLALAIAAITWLANLSLCWFLTRAVPLPRDFDLSTALPAIATWELTAFCVAWFATSLIDSPAFAALAGLLTPLLVLWGLCFVAIFLRLPRIDTFIWWPSWYVACLTLAPVCFALGTWHYLRRVEP